MSEPEGGRIRWRNDGPFRKYGYVGTITTHLFKISYRNGGGYGLVSDLPGTVRYMPCASVLAAMGEAERVLAEWTIKLAGGS